MFEVVITNEILGNASFIMSMEQLKRFNLCAWACAKESLKDSQPHTMGMWTVKPLREGATNADNRN